MSRSRGITTIYVVGKTRLLALERERLPDLREVTRPAEPLGGESP